MAKISGMSTYVPRSYSIAWDICWYNVFNGSNIPPVCVCVCVCHGIGQINADSMRDSVCVGACACARLNGVNELAENENGLKYIFQDVKELENDVNGPASKHTAHGIFVLSVTLAIGIYAPHKLNRPCLSSEQVCDFHDLLFVFDFRFRRRFFLSSFALFHFVRTIFLR